MPVLHLYLPLHLDLFPNMRISSRFKPFLIAGAAITIAGCAATLPEPPTVLDNPVVTAPFEASEPVAASPSGSNTRGINTGNGQSDPVAGSGSGAGGAAAAAADLSDELGIQVLHKANYNPFELDNGKSFRTLQSQEFYISELGRHSIETPKEVDFNTQQILVSSAGEKPTGGYNISVTKVEDSEDGVVVTVVQSIPGPGCINTPGKTHPFEFVLIPSTKPIQVFETQKVENCR